MEKAFQKFLKKMLSEDYPDVLDVRVVERPPYGNNLYDVFLIFKNRYSEEFVFSGEVKGYVRNLSTYMNLKILNVFTVLDGEY